MTLMVDTYSQPSNKSEQERSAKRKDTRAGFPDLAQSLDTHASLALPRRADLTACLHLFLTTPLTSTTPFLFPPKVRETERVLAV
jgi:hypothetical protein